MKTEVSLLGSEIAKSGVKIDNPHIYVSVSLMEALTDYLRVHPNDVWVSPELIAQILIESNVDWTIY